MTQSATSSAPRPQTRGRRHTAPGRGAERDRPRPRTREPLDPGARSIGVVYGDIGTSPLYAFREALVSARADGILLREEVLGVASLILWALVLIVTIKYVVILMRWTTTARAASSR